MFGNKTNNNRRFPGESNNHRPDKAAERRLDAKERQEKSDSLSVQERLSKLDAKFGNGVGAAKERHRLQKQLNAPSVQNSVKHGSISEIDEILNATLPADIMAEIEALNEENGSKKKLKAKDRRAKKQNNN